MDGNRRWAREKGLNPWDGYSAGVDTIKKISNESDRLNKEYGLEQVTLYAFSTENWNRDKKEVEFLMDLLKKFLKDLTEDCKKENVRVVFLGERERFSEDIRKLMEMVEEKTKDNTGFTVAFALSYGGRPEIIDGVNNAIEKGEKVTEESFKNLLWTKDIMDPDLIIRTGGEKRLSNFLTWGSVYSELFFTDTYWPDFSVAELEKIFAEFLERERRHGK